MTATVSPCSVWRTTWAREGDSNFRSQRTPPAPGPSRGGEGRPRSSGVPAQEVDLNLNGVLVVDSPGVDVVVPAPAAVELPVRGTRCDRECRPRRRHGV